MLISLKGVCGIKNKVLIQIYVPTINQTYDIFIPIEKTIGTIKKVVMETIGEFTSEKFENEMRLIDQDTNKLYLNDQFVKNTEIRNGSRLLLI